MKYDPMIRLCLFCKRTPSEGATFESKEHIFSESLGNKEIILYPGVTCDDCNNYFSQLENIFIRSYPGLFGRFIYTDRTKKGKSPKTNLPDSMSIERVKGTRDIIICHNITSLQFPNWEPQILLDKKPVPVFTALLPSEDLNNTSRILAKIALELLYLYAPNHAFSSALDTIRIFARQGAYRKIRFIPYAWSPSLAQPFQYGIHIGSRQGQIISLLMWFSLPGMQYLYPMFLSLISLSFFLSKANAMNLKVETQGKISDTAYLNINVELGHYSGRQLYRQLVGIK